MKDNNEWSGPQDGLPPVGTECEIDTRFGWLPGKIVDHGDNYAVSHLHENKHNLKVDWSRTGFRPIQSERDDFAVDVVEKFSPRDSSYKDSSMLAEVARNMYDAGYRKPMSQAEAIKKIMSDDQFDDISNKQVCLIIDALGYKD